MRRRPSASSNFLAPKPNDGWISTGVQRAVQAKCESTPFGMERLLPIRQRENRSLFVGHRATDTSFIATVERSRPK